MFDSFARPGRDSATKKRLVTSTALAGVFYAAILGGVFALAGTRAPVVAEKEVEVTFEKLPKPAPPPPPPPPKAKPVKRVQPVGVSQPPPPQLVVPKEIPKEKPPESDQKLAMNTGDAFGSAGAVTGSPEPAPAVVEAVEAPVHREGPATVSEDDEPAECDLSELTSPAYPEEARAAGREGVVILKVVVNLNGHIGAVQVMKGDEPFVAAAMAAVKTWTCSPAKNAGGDPFTSYKILKIPFRLAVGGQ